MNENSTRFFLICFEKHQVRCVYLTNCIHTLSISFCFKSSCWTVWNGDRCFHWRTLVCAGYWRHTCFNTPTLTSHFAHEGSKRQFKTVRTYRHPYHRTYIHPRSQYIILFQVCWTVWNGDCCPLDSLSVSRLLTTRVFQYSDVFQVATTGDVIVTWSSVYIGW